MSCANMSYAASHAVAVGARRGLGSARVPSGFRRTAVTRGRPVRMRVSSVASEERPAPAPERRPPAQPYAPPSVTLTRGQLVRKDVVTRTSGVRLGNATQLWVDVDEWEVVALDVKPFVRNALLNGVAGGAVDHVLMSSLRQVGDVILVHDESAVERRWSSYGLSTVVGCDVVTERGTYIGRVRDFEFNPDDGMVQRIVVDALGLPIVPEGVVSTYAVDVTEILSTGMDRIILAEGAESRVEQLSASLLQRLQLTAPPWEDDLAAYADYYEADVRAAQQAEWERQQAWARQSQMDSQRMRRDDYYAAPPPPAQQTQRERYYQDSRSMEGIPLVRPNQPFERRDADGGYGERPPPQRQRQQQSMEQPGGGRAIGDWMVREERRREMEMEYEYADGGYEPMREMNGRGETNRRVESPPPPPADAWAKAAPPRNGSDDSNNNSSKSDGWDSASSGSVSGGARKGFDADEDML